MIPDCPKHHTYPLVYLRGLSCQLPTSCSEPENKRINSELSLNSVKTVGEQQVVTARISLGILQGKEEVVENWKRFLEIIVGRDKETIDFKLSEDNSNTLNLEFVAKCEGRYSVSVICMGRVLGVAQWWWRSLVALSVLGMMTTYKENMIRDTLKVAPLGSPSIRLLTVYYSQELSQVFLVSLFMIAWY